MEENLLEKIFRARSGKRVQTGDVVNLEVDARVARDFGGANVVKNIKESGIELDDPSKTFFTFDCNPGGSDQRYAANQQACREFARNRGMKVYDINMGIGTHLAIEEGIIRPGEVFVSTDSHANIMGAIGAFGQGMGDVDIAKAFSDGKVWFKVPRSMRIELKGMPGPNAAAKDVVLRMLQELGANGLLGYAGEMHGPYVEGLGLAGRITVASMCTEMGGIILLFPPSERTLGELGVEEADIGELGPDAGSVYDGEIDIDIEGIGPMVARPGHPEDVVSVDEVKGTKIDSGFIGSCTNGRFEDLKAAAEVLRGRKVAPGVVLKVVPATRSIWNRCLRDGLMEIFMEAGALVGNAGCAGCAAGQIGQNGPGEVTVSTGNRNYRGKQGKGSVYLASPETVAASAVAGYITSKDSIPERPAVFGPSGKKEEAGEVECSPPDRDVPKVLEGRVWYVPKDNIDTDMIYHNKHLAVTDTEEMGQFAFGNLEGWEDFSEKAAEGDIIVTGKNFGAGSSRQQAVDCFRSLGVSAILAESFGAIYERNAINSGMPVMTYTAAEGSFENGDRISVDLKTGRIKNLTKGKEIEGRPFSDVQMDIYRRGGLLVKVCEE